MKSSLRIVVASLSFGACGGSKTAPAADLGATADLAVVAADQSPGACNTLSLDAVPSVEVQTSSAAGPTAQGGTIVDGTYYLVSSTVYFPTLDADTAGMLRDVVSVHTGVIDQRTDTGTESSSTYTTSGTTIDIADTCPDAKTHQRDCTATPTTLTLIQSSKGASIVAVFERQ